MAQGRTCLITGKLASIGIQQLEGKLTLTNTVPVSTLNEDGDPVTILPFVDEVVVTGGDIIFAVTETETIKLSVRWNFYPKISVDPAPVEYGDSIYELYSIIPDSSTYDFAQLADTGFTNDTIATGAIVVAREMLTNPNLLNLITANLGDYKQSANPSPSTSGIRNFSVWIDSDNYDVFLAKTDLLKWFKQTQNARYSNTSLGSTGIVTFDFPFDPNFTKFILNHITCDLFTPALNNSSNYYTFQFGYRSWNGTAFTQFAAPFNHTYSTQSLGANVRDQNIVKPGLNISPQIDTNTASDFAINVVRVGTPGNINFKCNIGLNYFYE